MPRYVFNADSPLILLQQVAEHPLIKDHFRAYGEYSASWQRTLRPTFHKLLNVLCGDDVNSFVNAILSPHEVAEHIYPANKVTDFCYSVER